MAVVLIYSIHFGLNNFVESNEKVSPIKAYGKETLACQRLYFPAKELWWWVEYETGSLLSSSHLGNCWFLSTGTG
ncbi:hypothetical protein Leryth_009670 [Lithospermum erythrorhizon]|nr:hypothetical protein Leryth_009670 [Lithospermum erythrorhizon]